mmetsp:Transcript_43426/g.86159  ORF Transcript_43426/g.86159 Transcript_43426/m.86159 type:complete len:276 (+) Transcript_43426:453-1280(+)
MLITASISRKTSSFGVSNAETSLLTYKSTNCCERSSSNSLTKRGSVRSSLTPNGGNLAPNKTTTLRPKWSWTAEKTKRFVTSSACTSHARRRYRRHACFAISGVSASMIVPSSRFRAAVSASSLAERKDLSASSDGENMGVISSPLLSSLSSRLIRQLESLMRLSSTNTSPHSVQAPSGRSAVADMIASSSDRGKYKGIRDSYTPSSAGQAATRTTESMFVRSFSRQRRIVRNTTSACSSLGYPSLYQMQGIATVLISASTRPCMHSRQHAFNVF